MKHRKNTMILCAFLPPAGKLINRRVNYTNPG